MHDFRPLDISDVIKAVKLLPDKQCSANPMPTWLLKECADVLAPFLCHMFNASLQQGYVLSIFKSAFITPLLKKSDLDSADVKAYRLISNLSVLSKLLERLVARQLLDYLNAHHLLPDCQVWSHDSYLTISTLITYYQIASQRIGHTT